MENAAKKDTVGVRHDASPDEEYYTCPMHPSVRSDRPGACPVCGMSLVKKVVHHGRREEASVEVGTVSLSSEQRVHANISTTIVSRADLAGDVTCVGVVDVAEPLQAKVTARFNGRIEKLFVNFTGAVVRKGEPLFELYSPDLAAAGQELMLLARGSGDSTEPDPDQDRLLAAARDRLEFRFGLTKDQIAEMEQSRSSGRTLMIRSPISGTVISKGVQEGEYVSEGMMLYQLADLSIVWVYLDVYEQDVRYVHPGQTVEMTTESYPNLVVRGKVTFLDAVINPETRTVRVRSEFPNPAGRLKPQMFVKARIQMPAQRVLTIPVSAVLATGRHNVVWVEMQNNEFQPRNVELGKSSGGLVEVMSGLREGETVVSTGGFLLDSESQLQQPADGHGQH